MHATMPMGNPLANLIMALRISSCNFVAITNLLTNVSSKKKYSNLLQLLKMQVFLNLSEKNCSYEIYNLINDLVTNSNSTN